MAANRNLVKIALIGDRGVGKSSIFNRFINHSFTDSHISSTGVDLDDKVVYCSWGGVKVRLVDLRDQLTDPYRGNGGQDYHAAILVFDLTDPRSFDNVKKQLKNLNSADSSCRLGDRTNIILVGTKADLRNERNVLPDEIETLRRELNCEYLEVSAKTGENVQQIFTNLATRVVQKRSPELFKKPEAKPAGVFDSVANGFRSLFTPKPTTTSKPPSSTQPKEPQRPAMLPLRAVPTQRSTSESHSAVNIAKFNYLQDDYFRLVAKVPGAYSNVLKQYNIQSLIQEVPLGKSERGWNLLHFLAYSDDAESVRSLHRRLTSQPQQWKELLAGQTYGSKATPLTIAIQQKNWSMVSVLLELGAEQTMEDRQAMLKRYESEKTLSQGRGNVAGPSSYANMRSQGMSVPSVVHAPSAPPEEPSVGAMRDFQPQGVSATSVANAQDNISGITPSAPPQEASVRSMRNFQPPQEQNLYAKEFTDAIAAGNQDIVSEKLTSGVSQKLLKTGLHCAIKHDQVDMVTLFIAHGAEVTERALDIACQRNNKDMLALLTGNHHQQADNPLAEAVNHRPNLSLFELSR